MKTKTLLAFLIAIFVLIAVSCDSLWQVRQTSDITFTIDTSVLQNARSIQASKNILYDVNAIDSDMTTLIVSLHNADDDSVIDSKTETFIADGDGKEIEINFKNLSIAGKTVYAKAFLEQDGEEKEGVSEAKLMVVGRNILEIEEIRQVKVTMPAIIYDGSLLINNMAIDFLKGLVFTCETDGASIEYNWGNGNYKQIEVNENTGEIPNGTTSVTVRAVKSDMKNSEEVTVHINKIYSIGDTGPGGGVVFFADNNGAYKEVVVGDSTEIWLSQAISNAENYEGGEKTDWFLPNKHELNEIYNERNSNNIIETTIPAETYWSTTIGYSPTTNTPPNSDAFPNKSTNFGVISGADSGWTQNFSTGTQAIKENSAFPSIGTLYIRCYNPVSYSIGQTGPGGGIVFWAGDNGAYREISGNIQYNDINYMNWWVASGTWDDYGNENDDDVIGNYTGGGFDDWYLPDIYELMKVSNERNKVGAIVEEINIWSSYEVDTNHAWYYSFKDTVSSSSARNTYKNSAKDIYKDNIEVRAVRAFNTSSL